MVSDTDDSDEQSPTPHHVTQLLLFFLLCTVLLAGVAIYGAVTDLNQSVTELRNELKASR